MSLMFHPLKIFPEKKSAMKHDWNLRYHHQWNVTMAYRCEMEGKLKQDGTHMKAITFTFKPFAFDPQGA